MDKTDLMVVGRSLEKAARAGGEAIMTYFGREVSTDQKTNGADLVSEADLASEKAILAVIADQLPGSAVFSEEAQQGQRQPATCMVIDPLDGTHNFLLGIPYFGVSIAYLVDGEVHAAAVYQPVLQQMYHARLGQGAYLDETRLRVSDRQQIDKSVAAFACSYTNSQSPEVRSVLDLFERKRFLRVLRNWCPSLDLCLLSAGKIDAMLNIGNEIYDFAAGLLIAREAGAQVQFLKTAEHQVGISHYFVAGATSQLLDVIM